MSAPRVTRTKNIRLTISSIVQAFDEYGGLRHRVLDPTSQSVTTATDFPGRRES
jgi:hypothetical protein